MTPVEKFREQVKIATDAQVERGTVHYVTMTADEAAALLGEIEGPAVVTIDASKLDIDELRRYWAEQSGGSSVVLLPRGAVSAPPYESDDVHHD